MTLPPWLCAMIACGRPAASSFRRDRARSAAPRSRSKSEFCPLQCSGTISTPLTPRVREVVDQAFRELRAALPPALALVVGMRIVRAVHGNDHWAALNAASRLRDALLGSVLHLTLLPGTAR